MVANCTERSFIRFVGLTHLSAIRYMVLSSATIMALYGNYLNIDEEEYGGHIGLLGEGLTPSFFLFLVRARWMFGMVLSCRNPVSCGCMDFWLTSLGSLGCTFRCSSPGH